MSKRIIILVLILAIVATLAVCEHKILEDIFKELEFRLVLLDYDLQNSNANINDINEIIRYWEQRRKVLHLVIPHADIRPIEIYLYQLKNAIEYEKYFEASEYAEVLISQVENLPKSFIFCAENIF